MRGVTPSLALQKLPAEFQDRIERGEGSARSGDELSRVADDRLPSDLANQAASGTRTHREIGAAARKKPDRRRSPVSGIRRTFFAEHGRTVTVSSRQPGTYHDPEQALIEVLAEVRLRIASNVRLRASLGVPPAMSRLLRRNPAKTDRQVSGSDTQTVKRSRRAAGTTENVAPDRVRHPR